MEIALLSGELGREGASGVACDLAPLPPNCGEDNDRACENEYDLWYRGRDGLPPEWRPSAKQLQRFADSCVWRGGCLCWEHWSSFDDAREGGESHRMRFYFNGKKRSARALSLAWYTGTAPEEASPGVAEVRARCRRPGCVHPLHLYRNGAE